MSDDTVRRERGMKWAGTKEPDGSWQYRDLLEAYMAGAREEAAIHEKKIQNLRDLVKSQEQDIDRMYAEIAALREAVRWAHGSLGDMVRDIWASAHPAVRRALGASDDR